MRTFDAKVLLLEAGPARGSPILAMPAGYMKFLASDAYLTMHHAVPRRQRADHPRRRGCSAAAAPSTRSIAH